MKQWLLTAALAAALLGAGALSADAYGPHHGRYMDRYDDDRYEYEDDDWYDDDRYEHEDDDWYDDDRYEHEDDDWYDDDRYEHEDDDWYDDDRYEHRRPRR